MIYKAGQFINLFVEKISPIEATLNPHPNFESHVFFRLLPDEQVHQLSTGSEVLCILYKNQAQNELFASMRLEHHANRTAHLLKTNQKVKLFVINESNLGYKCIIDGQYIGMLYHNEVFQKLTKNQQIDGVIKKIREDLKIDLILRAPGHFETADIADKIISLLKENNGFLDITDKTPPEKIYDLFGVSKKKFKIALGGLYKARKLNIDDKGLHLTS